MDEEEDKTPDQTVRQRMIALLGERDMSARELSQALGIRERLVYEHLDHVARSLASHGKRLEPVPFRCLHCGFIFKERKRLTRPGRCPRCKKGHLETPVYRITDR
ncbi:MAG: transcriptional regulator [Deltaproteobacteria bacterium]|nr:transcriptional regulator [Deltaproteobacteria bacterium]